MSREEAKHIVDVAFSVPLAVRRVGEDRTYLEDEIREAKKMAIKVLEQEPKTGRWIEHFDESGKWYECDQCHTDWGGAVNYCPNCGARMVDEQERKVNNG